MKHLSPLLIAALAILLIDAGRDLLRGDYWGALRTALVVVLVAIALRPKRSPTGSG